MAMRNFFNEIRGMRVKDLPQHVKPMLSVGYVKKAVQRGLDNYCAKYIETDSIQPLYHVCFGGMIFSYLVNLPMNAVTLSTSNTPSNTADTELSVICCFRQDPGC